MATTWPWVYTCEKLAGSYEKCSNIDECKLNYYCSYASLDDKNNDIRKCLPLNSLDHMANLPWDGSYPATLDDIYYNG